MVQIRGLSKHFDGVVAVDNVSLDIQRGELFAILGSSGCGKTTLLRMLAGFERPTSGQVLIDGVDMTEAQPYERPVNLMFQSYALFPHMSVAGNVGYGLRKEGLPAAQIRERVAEMLALVKLENLAARKPDKLSGGQQQRVALARALVKRPKLLLPEVRNGPAVYPPDAVRNRLFKGVLRDPKQERTRSRLWSRVKARL